MEIEVKIRALMMDPNSGTPIIILKDVEGDTMLPIWVGAYEANAIALEIEKIAPPRPMTHDLLRNLLTELGIQVERVVVTSLRDNTFFAVIEMRNSDGDRMVLDSRPSDAIALALRADCPHPAPQVLRADGGMARNDVLLQAQADFLGIPVERPAVLEAAALGAAYLAGLATGVWGGVDDLARAWQRDHVFEPRLPEAQRDERFAAWQAHVPAARAT